MDLIPIAKIVPGLFSSKAHDDFWNFLEKLNTFETDSCTLHLHESIYNICNDYPAMCVILTGLGEYFNYEKKCQFTHNFFQLAIPVIAMIIDPAVAASNPAIQQGLRILQKTVSIVDKIDIVSITVRVALGGTRILASNGKTLFQIVAGKVIYYLKKNGTVVRREKSQSTFDESKLSEQDGKVYYEENGQSYEVVPPKISGFPNVSHWLDNHVPANLLNDITDFLATLDDNALQRLDDHLGDTAFRNALNGKAKLVKAWEVIYKKHSGPNATRPKDVELLNAVSNALDDAEFMAILSKDGLDGVEELSQIIKSNTKAVCCGTPSPNGGLQYNFNESNIAFSPINAYISDFRSTVKILNNNDVVGLPGFIGKAKSSPSPNSTTGVHPNISEINQFVRLSAAGIIDANIIRELDRLIPNSTKRFDAKSVNDKYTELKSIDSGPGNNIANNLKGPSFGQYIAYLKEIEKLEDLIYFIDIGKIKPPQDPNWVHAGLPLVDQQRMFALEQMKVFYKDKADDIIKQPSKGGIGEAKFNTLFGTSNVNVFKNQVNNFNDIAFSIFRIE